jgi:outer membrane lipoprotein-sorting protein
VRKISLLLTLAALLATLGLIPAGCSSEKTTMPATILPAATSPAASLPASHPAAATAAVPDASAGTPSASVTTLPPAAATTQAGPAMDQMLKALMDKSLGISSMKYDVVISNGIMNSKAYQKKSKSRMDTSMMGMNMVLITDKDKQIMFTYLVDQNKAMKTELNQAVPAANQSDIQDLWNYNLVVKGTEPLDGKICTVAEYSKATPQGNASGKVWLWQDYGLPLRMDTTMSGTGKDSLNMTVTIEFKNYEFVDIPDSRFELPAGVEMVDKLDFFPSGLPSGQSAGKPAPPPAK